MTCMSGRAQAFGGVTKGAHIARSPKGWCPLAWPASAPAAIHGLPQAFAQADPRRLGQGLHRESLPKCDSRLRAPAARELDPPERVEGERTIWAPACRAARDASVSASSRRVPSASSSQARLLRASRSSGAIVERAPIGRLRLRAPPLVRRDVAEVDPGAHRVGPDGQHVSVESLGLVRAGPGPRGPRPERVRRPSRPGTGRRAARDRRASSCPPGSRAEPSAPCRRRTGSGRGRAAGRSRPRPRSG